MTTHSSQHQYLVDYLLGRSAKMRQLLIKGDPAPSFILKYSRDSLISLDQFRGNIVYLSFWFVGCAGCYQEFPDENTLVDKFAGQPVRIVSICTSTDLDKWQETVNKVGLRTINLFADLYWKRKLETSYGVSVYPRYVLIGVDGEIIENFSSYPSQGAENKIQAALSKLKK